MKKNELIVWYSFDEKKPDNCMSILVADQGDTEMGVIAVYAEDGRLYDYDGQAPNDQNFTHWSYFPTFNTFIA